MTADQAAEMIGYLAEVSVLLEGILGYLAEMELVAGYILGVLAFFAVVLLCRYVYRFFSMFFPVWRG